VLPGLLTRRRRGLTTAAWFASAKNTRKTSSCLPRKDDNNINGSPPPPEASCRCPRPHASTGTRAATSDGRASSAAPEPPSRALEKVGSTSCPRPRWRIDCKRSPLKSRADYGGGRGATTTWPGWHLLAIGHGWRDVARDAVSTPRARNMVMPRPVTGQRKARARPANTWRLVAGSHQALPYLERPTQGWGGGPRDRRRGSGKSTASYAARVYSSTT